MHIFVKGISLFPTICPAGSDLDYKSSRTLGKSRLVT